MAEPAAPIEQIRSAYEAAIVRTDAVHGIPVARVKKDSLPLVAHYVHTHPRLRGVLSLLWAVDHRPREARYELWYLFSLAAHHEWLLLSTDVEGEDRCF
ncbi:MAG: hypothetical protein C4293_21210, partial [Nitrospiraceae bacterium]